MKLSKTRRPCFGFFLQGSVKVVAFAHAFVAVGSLFIFIVGSFTFFPWSQVKARNPIDGLLNDDDPKNQKMYAEWLGSWIALWIIWLCEIPLSLFLYRGSKQRNSRRLKFWVILEVICCILWTGAYFWDIWYRDRTSTARETHLAILGATIAYKLYAFWVVGSFIREIGQYGGLNNVVRRLDDADVYEFEKGTGGGTSEGHQGQGPYNRDFEIPMDQLSERGTWIEIGAGAFGKVFKVVYSPPDGRARIDVAVKTVISLEDIEFFKALLSELKTLTYIGHHPNIVNLVGAQTDQIKSRNLMIIMEFCPYGNLKGYLKTKRGLFVNLVDPEGHNIQVGPKNGQIGAEKCADGYSAITVLDSVTTKDLLRWALDISSGMEFLASKQIIHADLAARNVLLSADKVAKIGDFGLARRLYSYRKNYVRSKQKLLPWPHLALESLKDLVFSKESDIWALGVTLYEVFSLGMEPYHPQFLEFSKDFFTALESGMRLGRPQYCPNSVYNIMTECWNECPENRPKYPDITARLKAALAEFHVFDEQSAEVNP